MGDAAVIGRVECRIVKLQSEWMSMELNSLHFEETGFCMLEIKKCTKGEQVNCWVSFPRVW